MQYIVNDFIKNSDVKLENVISFDILKVYSSVYNRIGIPIHTIPSPVLPGTDVFSVGL